MNHRKLLLQMASLLLIVLVSATCGPVQPTSTPVPPPPTPTPTALPPPLVPKVVHYPEPQLTVSTDWPEEAGCTTPSAERGYGYWDCTATGPLGTLGCEMVRVDDLLGGLSPAYPLMVCVSYTRRMQHRSKWTEGGCLRTVYTTLARGQSDRQF
jgi:hypothetical protein